MAPSLPQKRDAPSQSPGNKPQRFVHANPAQPSPSPSAPAPTLAPTLVPAPPLAGPSRAANGGAIISSPAPAPPKSSGDDDGFTKVLTKEERRKLRKVEKHKPQFQFDVGQFRSGKKIGIAHVRDFVMYLLVDGVKPQWIVAENKGNISHVVVLMIPGLLPSHIGLDIPIAANLPFTTQPLGLDSPASQVPIINQTFLRGIPTRAPGDSRKLHSVMQTLLQAPLTDARRKELEQERAAERDKAEKQASQSGADKDPPPFSYLLTPNQMLDNGYNPPTYIRAGDEVVIPGHERDGAGERGANGAVAGPSKLPSADRVVPADTHHKWVETPEAEGPPPDGRWPVLAVDCEMVETSKGSELARVSIVDYSTGLNVFDELVKPPDPVINYRTQWSGMTAARLAHATHTLTTIQHALVTGPGAILTPHTILLGHSLECDLNALHIRHALCIDTALLYKHPRGAPYKPSLKWLAQRYLQREIQGGKGGHDSEEDASACVGLLKEKIANGPEFGAFTEFTESIFERLARTPVSGGKGGADGRGHTSAVCDYSNPKTGHGARATTSVKCNTDDEVVDAVLEHAGTHDLTFARLMQLANHTGFNGPENTPEDAPPLSTALSNLDTHIARLVNGLPKHAALVVLNGHSDPRPMVELAQRRAKWERLVREAKGDPAGVAREDRWMAEDERALEESVARAREGMAFFCVKG